jgi:hypothetical protein
MALGGSTVSWQETFPAGAESIGLGDNRIRSLKTDIRTGLDSEHNWPSSGATNTGYHRYGSARPFFGAQSLASSTDTDGRMLIASDTSRLFGVGSAGTVLLGPGPLGLSIDSSAYITFPQRARWAMEVGFAVNASDEYYLVTFPNSGFSTVPFLSVIPLRSNSAASTNGSHVAFNLTSLTASGFSGIMVLDSNGGGVAATSPSSLYWAAIGHRAL